MNHLHVQTYKHKTHVFTYHDSPLRTGNTGGTTPQQSCNATPPAHLPSTRPSPDDPATYFVSVSLMRGSLITFHIGETRGFEALPTSLALREPSCDKI